MKKLSVIVVASVLIFGMASNAYAGVFYAYADTVLSFSPDNGEVDSASGTHLGIGIPFIPVAIGKTTLTADYNNSGGKVTLNYDTTNVSVNLFFVPIVYIDLGYGIGKVKLESGNYEEDLNNTFITLGYPIFGIPTLDMVLQASYHSLAVPDNKDSGGTMYSLGLKVDFL